MATRRDFLKSALLLAASGQLAACRRGIVRPPSCSHFEQPHSTFVVDAHCHIFNATDLQVAGFINESFLKLGDNEIVGAFARLVQALGWSLAPDAQEELNWLRSGNREKRPLVAAGRSRLQLQGAPPLDATIHGMGADTDVRYAQFWKEAAKRDGITTRAFLNRMMSYQTRFRNGFSGMSTQSFLSALQSPEGLRETIVLEQTLEQSGSAFITFLKAFFRFRIENAWTMMQMYGCDTEPGVDMICPALVDFDLWLGRAGDDEGKTKSHLDKQLELMGEISLATKGRVQALAPFNPLRAACGESHDYLDRARDAVVKHGCIGFKLYPPMGFRPIGNAEIGGALPECPSSAKKVSRADIDEVLWSFFSQCADMGIPILAHASKSNGPSSKDDAMADPVYWGRLLEQAPGGQGRKLRVSLGHMGGDHDVDKPSCWRNEIIEMMGKFPGQVFADLAYYQHALGDRTTRARLAAQMHGLRERAVSEHVMYGSDWDMLGIEPRANRYLAMVESFLTEDLEITAEQVRGILGGNAKAFFGLRPGDQGAERLRKFHDSSEALPFESIG